MEAAGLVFEGNARDSLTVSSLILMIYIATLLMQLLCRVVLGHGLPRSHHESLEEQWIN